MRLDIVGQSSDTSSSGIFLWGIGVFLSSFFALPFAALFATIWKSRTFLQKEDKHGSQK